MAASEPAPAGLEAHLASCEACRAELAGLRRVLAVADAEMAGLLAAEPTPELAVRIRQAVAESDPSPGWRFGWLWPAVAAAVTLLVALVVVVGRGGPTPERRVAVDANRPQQAGTIGSAEPARELVIPSPGPTDAPLGAKVVARSTGESPVKTRDDGVPGRTHSAGRRAIPVEPGVLVPPGETEALLRFAAQLQRRAVAPDSLLVADLSAPLAEPRAVEIAPLEIVPLDPAETSGTD